MSNRFAVGKPLKTLPTDSLRSKCGELRESKHRWRKQKCPHPANSPSVRNILPSRLFYNNSRKYDIYLNAAQNFSFKNCSFCQKRSFPTVVFAVFSLLLF
ncbi:hypothetical protein ATANTOWER_016922 [Ataeniobius toweri]|uniref:Uncharacterized protein n=1 Tax=Ataeniobius toweri TaxID=208326 RepID=A0ABU7AYB1_9TELE|nr:hypothetical protein [Ataeniobius toweri]